ncbi:MAG TPA: FAD-dependent oxidoreductase [Solirubrobacterales bacterium]|jgi:2,4-dienoyl-CoA reductase (NADPH2)|nr:FAD-dependent oxidoreductase [Solirubrobacterales bacterium]
MPDPPQADAPKALPHVFAPVTIGSLELPHRIVMGSMHLGVEGAEDAGERLAAFYRERALGGAGLIVTGGWAVSADGAADESYGVLGAAARARALGATGRGADVARDDATLGALEQIAGSTAGTEAAIALQLFHAGRYALADSPGEVVAPSAVASRVSRVEPRALAEEEVWDVVAEFAAGAKLARELGFAAVEVMGSEGYLVDQFLSSVTNRRDDYWGGDAEGRMRFGLEVALAVREAVGADFPVIFRMTGAELMPDSRPWEEVQAFAATLVGAGVDALNIGVGWHESPVPTVQGAVPAGAWVPWAEGIKTALRTGMETRSAADGGRDKRAITGTATTSAGEAAVPVIAGNRVNGLAQAEEILASGGVDMVSMSRPFLADPRIVEKGRSGGAVNVCISCDQACIDVSLVGGHVSCLVNPSAGHEVEFPSPALSSQKSPHSDENCERAGEAATVGGKSANDGAPRSGPGRFVVIGGGPAGLEAARVLATLGGDVHLYEAREELGGQFRWARLVPGKEDYGATISYFESELRRLGVHVHLGHELGEDDADVLGDCVGVVLATGVHPRPVDIPGSSLPHVVDYATAFESGLGDARSVAIVGAGGIGVDLAHLLTHEPSDVTGFYERYGIVPPAVERKWRIEQPSLHSRGLSIGTRVTLMRRSGRVGSGIGRTTRWVWLDALKHAGVETRTGLSYRQITPDGIEIALEDGGVEMIAADRVVIAAGQERRDELRPLLEQLEIPHQVVGGAENPSELNAVRAFGDGLRAAYALAQAD